MATSYEILRARMSPERRARNDRATQKLLAELALQDLRQALDLTPAQAAEVLELNQAALSNMEGQGDLYVTTLRRSIEALGGHLKLVASFPDREVVINSTEQRQEAALTDIAA